MKTKVKKIVFFDNGMVFATDEQGEQMPEIQRQSWVRLYLGWLLTQGHDLSEVEFTLPGGRRAELHVAESGDAEDVNWTIR